MEIKCHLKERPKTRKPLRLKQKNTIWKFVKLKLFCNTRVGSIYLKKKFFGPVAWRKGAFEIPDYADIGVTAVGGGTGDLSISFEGGVPIFQFYRNWITIHIFCFLDDMVVPNLAADEACRFMFMLGCAKVNVTVWPTINPLAIRQVYLSELRI